MKNPAHYDKIEFLPYLKTSLKVLVLGALAPLVVVASEPSLPSDAVRIKQEFERSLESGKSKLASDYINRLERLKTNYTKSGDLDSVLAIGDEIQAAKTYTSEYSLADGLKGTTWQWSGSNKEKIYFASNGIIKQEGWEKRGLETTWEVIDRRTVLLRVTKGRDQNLHAILLFAESAKGFTGFDFDGKLLNSSQLVFE
ncbi:MAG: hypothetical protein AAGA58_10495 [Verrucomicrobiota bacterium]